jgi:hypothetical protein
MTCGGNFAYDSVSDKLLNRDCASRSLLFLGVSALGALVAHGLAVAMWRTLPWTKEKPLPDFLVFPVPELLVAGLLVMPLGVASATLLMQVGDAGGQALGAVAAALLLAYLGLVGAVLLGVSARKELLGLRYISHSQGSRPDQDQAKECPPLESILEGGDHSAMVAVESTAKHGNPTNAELSGRSSVRSLLLRVAPPHAAGYWERPDVAVQQELRRTYQSGLGALPFNRTLHQPGRNRPLTLCGVFPAGGKRATLRLVSSLVRHQASGMPLVEQDRKVGASSEANLQRKFAAQSHWLTLQDLVRC